VAGLLAGGRGKCVSNHHCEVTSKQEYKAAAEKASLSVYHLQQKDVHRVKVDWKRDK
jgi:hypothetical protein